MGMVVSSVGIGATAASFFQGKVELVSIVGRDDLPGKKTPVVG